MKVSNLCIFISFLLPYIFITLAKAGAPGFSNKQPRIFLNKLTGWRNRAHAAQLNSFEIFAPFAASVVLAQINQVNQITIDILAMAFIGFRILHGVFYIYNKSTLRSIVWFGGFSCVIALFFA